MIASSAVDPDIYPIWIRIRAFSHSYMVNLKQPTIFLNYLFFEKDLKKLYKNNGTEQLQYMH